MQRIGIGYEYYKDFLDHNLYYVDKTLLIKDVIDFGGKKYEDMEEGLREAFAQIDEKRYEQGVLDEGYLGFVSFGGCFCKKSAMIEFKAAAEKER